MTTKTMYHGLSLQQQDPVVKATVIALSMVDAVLSRPPEKVACPRCCEPEAMYRGDYECRSCSAERCR
jgi:hypothetical protein